MVKILVVSDSHGNVSNMCDALERERPDLVFHLGDVVRDGYQLHLAHPEVELVQVAGNCDYLRDAPLERTVEVEGCKLILCHGHTYYVKNGYHYLAQHGREAGAAVILCGHTHRALHDTYGSLQVLNPGSVGFGPDPTYGILQVEEGAVTCAIRHVYGEGGNSHAADH
jgi:hypothetical protein